MIEYLAEKRAFRARLAQATPNHPHLPLIDADIVHTEAEVVLLPKQLIEPKTSETALTPVDAKTESPAQTPPASVEPKLVIPTPERLTTATFRDQLYEGLKGRGQEVDLPEPSAEIVEFHHILTDNGFDVAPSVYIDRKKKEATYAVLERVVRPEYTDGTQMYYAKPEGGTNDPLALILEEGRKDQKIDITSWTEHIPHNSRFGVSWSEIHSYVSSEVLNTIPHLAKVAKKGDIALRVPTKSEFQSPGQKYPHFGQANTWEWLYDNSGFGDRLIGGDRDHGGVKAVHDLHPGTHLDDIGFRLQGASPSQKLSR